ncbi:MAG: hypothetical protein ACE5FA_03370 [Dehalococcoidia bacterium]
MRLKVASWLPIGVCALVALALVRCGNDSKLECATSDQTWLNLHFMLDEGHADVILIVEPLIFSGRANEYFSNFLGDSEVSIEVRDRRNDVARSAIIPESGFIIVDYRTDYDPYDTTNTQFHRIRLEPDYKSITFANRLLDEPLRIHMLHDDGDYGSVYLGEKSIDEVADPIGTAIDLDAICEAQGGIAPTSR